MDETGISTTTNKPPKVLSIKGKKQVGVIASAERGQLTTMTGCCYAAGSFLPPFLIFARKKMQSRLLDGAPLGTQGTCTPNGWTPGEVFLAWLHFFVEYTRPNADKKVLLLLDNHESHKYYPALEYASSSWGIINQYDVARLLSPAFLKSSVAINAVHGFERPGIWPVNKHVFGEEHFEPADVIVGRSDMNISRVSIHSLQTIEIPDTAAEASSTPLPSHLQEKILTVDPPGEMIPRPDKPTKERLI
ncbi:uncharacterized protein LOC115879066 [Sitophilus oryzae]|uniref:Uncharacterized protein LOC115879066 n=1 Tax=Sitophilus oryzae TaxID=7048 RepID=A0A6J2XLM7_SITOR|nr:uncharacterized protein LOC115879066 [Sitophilus oryzae]